MQLEKMAADNVALQAEVENIYRKYEALKKFALEKGIPIPLDLEAL